MWPFKCLGLRISGAKPLLLLFIFIDCTGVFKCMSFLFFKKSCQLLNSRQRLLSVLCSTQNTWDDIRILLCHVIINNFCHTVVTIRAKILRDYHFNTCTVIFLYCFVKINQRKHSYSKFINYYAPTCFDTTVSSLGSSYSLPCHVT